MSNSSDDETDTGHLSDLEDGAGCTEIWETLSERRTESTDTGVAAEGNSI